MTSAAGPSACSERGVARHGLHLQISFGDFRPCTNPDTDERFRPLIGALWGCTDVMPDDLVTCFRCRADRRPPKPCEASRGSKDARKMTATTTRRAGRETAA